MPTLKIDGRDVPFLEGDTILRAAERAGIRIPYYCWHPGLTVAANCRMCLVEVLPEPGKKPVSLDILHWDAIQGKYLPASKPKLQPACQMPAVDGMHVLSDTSPHVIEARRAVQEFLLLNHPVDCPICDQAGECKLQDYWLAHQKTHKRMRDDVIRKPKAVSFGPTIIYDAERCILCTRCVRTCAEFAKDPVLSVAYRGNLGEIVVAPGRQLDHPYTLMTEHVCPVGALTSKDFRFKARVWFLRSAQSICQGCATGCRAWLDFDPRNQQIYRYRPRDADPVTPGWMCDEGMLSYRWVRQDRVLEARIRGRTASVEDATQQAAQSLCAHPHEATTVLLSGQHSNEDNFALAFLAKRYLGSGDFFLAGKAKARGDDILRHADKNPNAAGATDVASTTPPRSFHELLAAIEAGRCTHVLALGSEIPADAESAEPILRQLKLLVTISTWEGPLTRAAHVVLPACSWAEADGTYVNAGGIAQHNSRAIEPLGRSRPAWEHVARLSSALGFPVSWTRLKDIHQAMAPEAGAVAALASS